MATKNSINSSYPIEVAAGGTSATTFTSNSLLRGAGTSAITALGAATNGQIPIGNTGNAPTLAAITAGTNITVTNGAGTITIAATQVPGALEYIETQAASGASQVDFTTGIDSSYNVYYLAFRDTTVSVDGTNIGLRFSDDGGGTFIATGYQAGMNRNPYNSATVTNANGTTQVTLASLSSNASEPKASGFCWLFNLTNGNDPSFAGQTTYNNSTGPTLNYGWHGGYMGTPNIDALRIFPGSGTITGQFTLYGLKES